MSTSHHHIVTPPLPPGSLYRHLLGHVSASSLVLLYSQPFIQCSLKNPAMAFHCLNILPWIPNLPPYSMLQSHSDWPAVLGIFSALPVAGCPRIHLDGSSWISLPSTPSSPYCVHLTLLWYMCACSVVSIVFNSLRPSDCSPPGSSVHRILQARILKCFLFSLFF